MNAPAAGTVASRWDRKDLLAVADLSAAEIRLVLDTAEPFREVAGRPVKKVPTLRGKTVFHLFFVASPGDDSGFDVAARRLSADSVVVPVDDPADAAGLAAELDALAADLMVLRHPHPGVPAAVAGRVRAGVVNAGDGAHEDPVRALADAFTLRRRLAPAAADADAGDALAGRRIALIGDLAHSAAARSDLHLLARLGAATVVAGLHALLPAAVEALGAERVESVDAALEGADAVIVLPPHPSTADGRAYPSGREYHRLAGLTAERLARAEEGAPVLVAGPPRSGPAISAAVAERIAPDLAEQAGDALAVRMAALYLLAGHREEAA